MSDAGAADGLSRDRARPPAARAGESDGWVAGKLHGVGHPAAAKAATLLRQGQRRQAHVLLEAAPALALTPERIDLTGQAVVIETLKKRRRGVYRAVPVPPGLLDQLDCVSAPKRDPVAERS